MNNMISNKGHYKAHRVRHGETDMTKDAEKMELAK